MIPDQILNRVVSLILPDSITEIQHRLFDSFKYENLRNLIGKNVSFINDGAFHEFLSLEIIEFPSLTTVPKYTFIFCKSLKSIDIPNVTSIGEYSFAHCESLKSIKVPNVNNINNYAFYDCKSLESIDFPKMHKVNDNVFDDCTSLKTINLFKYQIEEFMPEVCGELYD